VTIVEANFDGLVGPTHVFGGLSHDNKAATASEGRVSNPRGSALQCLTKIRRLLDLGLVQGVLPPQSRPLIRTLRALGFTGSASDVLRAAWAADRTLVVNIYSASSMWVANAATVSPSADTGDGKVHFTPANLTSMFHRSLEAQETARHLKTIFAAPDFFVHHDPLPAGGGFGDEGAANHSRLCSDYGFPGIEVFAYGKSAFDRGTKRAKYLPRQSREASEAVARLHMLDSARTAFVRQSQQAIDSGAFHTDVVAVMNRNLIFAHETAFFNRKRFWAQLQKKCPFEVKIIEVSSKEIPLSDAVSSYIFNSQLVTLPNGLGMALILPEEVHKNAASARYIEKMKSLDSSIRKFEFVDVSESMNNGGGPACLRLRMVLTDEELKAINGKIIVDRSKISDLEKWVNKHYRDRLSKDDLRDVKLIEESQNALDELTTILNLPGLYDFQDE
jgi:succinylarginine dihydrolase